MRTKLQTSKKLSLFNVENKLIMEIKACPQYQAILRDLKINITTILAAKQDGVTTSKRKKEPFAKISPFEVSIYYVVILQISWLFSSYQLIYLNNFEA